jgi:hypothetical protein
MAKQILTEAQIIILLTMLNPMRIGKDANPIITTNNTFVLTGKKTKIQGGEEVASFVLNAVLTDAAKKANPNLVAGRYLRLMKTEQVKAVTTVNDAIEAARKPIADNLFENQNPMLFDTILTLLKKRSKVGDKVVYEHFEEMNPDRDGNPRLKLINPVKGAFLVLNMPPHFRVQTDGKILAGSRKDISTGEFRKAENIIFREMTLFLLPVEYDRLQSIAINRFQKLVEPMLSEEIVTTKLKAGVETSKEVTSSTTTAADVDEDNAGAADTNGDAGGVTLDENGLPL